MKNGAKKTLNLILCALFAALISVGALIKIPTPYVPITLQTLFVMLGAILLGKKKAATSVAIYILMGLFGVPVFAQGGGILYLFHPTFGYIIGFLAASYVIGMISSTSSVPSFGRLFLANLVGILMIYLIGMVYYYVVSHVYLHSDIGISALFFYCFFVTIPWDIVFCALAALIGNRIYPSVKRYL